MTTVSGDYSTYGDNYSNQSTKKTANSELGKDEFLKLLVAQLKNQDPMSPMQDKDFIAQLAQFSTLEQTSNMSSSIEELKNSMLLLYGHSLLTQGAAMIGKAAVAVDSSGKEISGRINSVKIVDNVMKVMVGDTLVTMEDIKEIKDANTGEA